MHHLLSAVQPSVMYEPTDPDCYVSEIALQCLLLTAMSMSSVTCIPGPTCCMPYYSWAFRQTGKLNPRF